MSSGLSSQQILPSFPLTLTGLALVWAHNNAFCYKFTVKNTILSYYLISITFVDFSLCPKRLASAHFYQNFFSNENWPCYLLNSQEDVLCWIVCSEHKGWTVAIGLPEKGSDLIRNKILYARHVRIPVAGFLKICLNWGRDSSKVWHSNHVHGVIVTDGLTACRPILYRHIGKSGQ